MITLHDETTTTGIRGRLIQRRTDYAVVLDDGWLAVVAFPTLGDVQGGIAIISRAISMATPGALQQHAERARPTVIIAE